METLKTVLIVSLGLLIAGCGVNQRLIINEGKQNQGVEVPDPSPKDPDVEEKIFLAGALPLTEENQSIKIESLRDKPLVLMFSGFGCQSCAEEINEIKNTFLEPNSPPENIHFLTILVGENAQTGALWKEHIRKVPWQVAVDEDLELFEELCGAQATPCTLIQTPEKGLIYKHIGKTPIPKIQELTGPWEIE